MGVVKQKSWSLAGLEPQFYYIIGRQLDFEVFQCNIQFNVKVI